MKTSALICASYLSPVLYKTYQAITDYLERELKIPTFLTVGESFEDLTTGQIDLAFICGLAYIQLVRLGGQSIELLAAPVLEGERYQRRPWYFSDIIVRKDWPYHSFEDLKGSTWAFNERNSHSGYNLVCYNLFKQGYDLDYFGCQVETSSHYQSLKLVLEGKADVAAVDSHMLDVVLRNQKELAANLKIIGMLGPSTIPPLVVSRSLDADLKKRLQDALIKMHERSWSAELLRAGNIERFVPITDSHYDDIREMYDVVQSQQFLAV